MKKIYTTIALASLTLAMTAQTKANLQVNGLQDVHELTNHTLKFRSDRATGDTVMYFDGQYIFGSGIDNTTFNIQNDDVDAKTVNTAVNANFGPASAFKFFYTLNTPTGDTNTYWGATSWFTPVGQADNWLEMGPITIPSAGAILKWHHNIQDPAFRDGYKVKISTTGLNNYTDFTNGAIFTVADQSPLTATDTAKFPYRVFYPRSVDLSAYAGQSIYVAIQHDANDMFIIWFDDVVITEGPLSVNENEFVNGVKVRQNMPNPAAAFTTISYELKEKSEVSLVVYDVTGKKVASQFEGTKQSGNHTVRVNTESLSAGVYYYSLIVGQNNSTAMKMVVVK
jgi:hypothetical protein